MLDSDRNKRPHQELGEELNDSIKSQALIWRDDPVVNTVSALAEDLG